eukprot:scaffold40574_cov27-Tisochrysis_lutea.AAC.22
MSTRSGGSGNDAARPFESCCGAATRSITSRARRDKRNFTGGAPPFVTMSEVWASLLSRGTSGKPGSVACT